MDFISVGQEARGFIAIGQHATGVFAFGQMATGVVAIGQVARGVFTLGQAAIGFIGWGQVGLGVLHAVGMVGAGGRGFGLVIRLVPSLGKKRIPPQTTTIDQIYAGQPGWVELDLFYDTAGIGFGLQGQRLPIKLDRKLIGDASRLTSHGPVHVWANLKRVGQVIVCDRIVHQPPRPYESKSWFTMGAFQFVGLLVLCCVWWIAVGNELIGVFQELASG